MNLIRKIPKQAKRSSRWKSQKHRNFVRSHACVICDMAEAIEVAHVRLGSGAGIAQKPHDYLTVSLCRNHHQEQHTVGEKTFWKGRNLDAIIEAFQRTSPCRFEIEQHQQEQGQ